jgi:dipeptidyl aminopeptidase/acylaminoacyl peptidase
LATSVEEQKNDKSNAKNDEPSKEAGQRIDGVYLFDLEKLKLQKILEGTGNYRRLAFNEKGNRLAFLTDKDDYEADSPSMSLYLWRSGQSTAEKIADESTEAFPENWWISGNAIIRFSEDDRRLLFATAPIPEEVLKERKAAAKKDKDGKVSAEEEDDDEKAKLDLWHWQDPLLQPQQLIQAETERRRDYRAVYDLRTKKIFQLATRELPVIVIDHRSKTDFALATTNLPYRKSLSWDVQGFQDCYLVNLKSGERKLVLKKSRANPRMSPEGNYLTWWDVELQKWFAMSTKAINASASESENPVEPIEISKGIQFPLENELHDTPSLPRPYGTAGWLQDDAAFLVYDRFDIWQLDPDGEEDPLCLTEGEGRKHTIQFRYQQLDPEQRAIDSEQHMTVTAFNETTKASGFYRLSVNSDDDSVKNAETTDTDSESGSLTRLIMLDERLSGLRKARDSEDVMFTRSTFVRCPDIWQSTTDFNQITRISDINPQQSEYRWGTAELVSWKSATGEELDGILYKPDGFDASSKYPLMVYFYERNSDNLHAYYTPAAGRSIINHSFYVSRGYLLFVPDIPYRTGEPGPSAYDSIVPGVQNLIAQGFVDEKRIGMQGHSWGGYQTAYLVTRTDMFACAESGAPVSNMTSAYGGIRWSSGMSRMFQYERTQSRIGQDLWSAREKYIANSPVFFADKINTPLLILHNDEDGAVPWYQGIELFVALRRLEKPAWLLNYNGNPHWVMGDANRRDFAVRMQQFFDHYLLDAPEPEWMAVGIPAVDKGKKFGLELLEPKKTPNTKEEEPAN